MDNQLINPSLTDALRNLMERSGDAVIVCHMTPDGDAMGSSLCLYNLLRTIGKSVHVIVPDTPPEMLMSLPGADEITIASYVPDRAAALLRRADLVFCLDFNDMKRIDRMAAMVEASRAPKVVIDHHLNPVIPADIVISHPEVSSTCALLFRVVEALGLLEVMDKDAATCCCAGMMTDTGNFSYNSNSADLYRILSILLEKGVDKDGLYTRLFNTNSESRIRIMGYGQSMKMQLFREHQAALITLSRIELDEFGYRRGDTEALVNIPLSIPGITYSIFLREDEESYVKISMRSKGDFSVKEICENHFNGGGHRNAAGGEMRAPLPEVIDAVTDIMPRYDSRLKK